MRLTVSVGLAILAALFCIGCGGRSTVSSQLPAAGPSAGVTISFAAQATTITPGTSTTLTWNSSNATSVTIDNGIGAVAANGSITVSPTATVTYHATASGPDGTAQASATIDVNAAPNGVPQFQHVVLVVEENHSYESVIGSAAMPYFNSLASTYGLASNYFANTHPSIGNYFELTTGQVLSNNDNFGGTVSSDNIVRQLLTAGKTWKSYTENLPAVGYIGGDVYPYARHHNPFTYFSDVINSSTERMNLAPFSQFAGDLANQQLPNFAFIAPNKINDAHDGSLQQADTWLKSNIAPLIANSAFQQDGLLIILFDEGDMTDGRSGGGRVAMLLISAKAKRGFKSTTFYQHPSTLKLILRALGVSNFPGASASAPEMAEFF
jgi:acid phosphatase